MVSSSKESELSEVQGDYLVRMGPVMMLVGR